jgi:cysteine-rich repeat protein
VADNSTVCGPSANECDPEELCDGTGVDCPADVTINDCIDDDGCCLNTVAGTPNGPCNNNNDNDCPIVCGNGALEAGEVCDDGNNVDEDGCSSDCSFLSAPVPASSRWSMTLLVTAMIAALVVVGRRRKTA